MSVLLNYNFNQVANAPWASSDILLSHAAIDLKCDPSQQLEVYGVDIGYYLSDADQTQFLAGNLFGFLDIQADPAVASLAYAGLGAPNIGTLIFNYQITSVNDLWKHIEFDNPYIFSGDRRLTFILGRPQFTGAANGPGTISLLVRGRVTQKSSEEKLQYGPFESRS